MHQAGKTWALACLLLLAACRSAIGAIAADELLHSLRPTADVNDYAGVLSAAEKEALEARCRKLREKTGAQLAIVTLPSLDGGNIEDFTNKLFERWGVGQKGRNNGLMLLVAMEERRSRLEVGYGLEPIIPDVLAGRIVDNVLRPEFRRGNYAAGLTAAADKVIELVEKGEPADRAALETAPRMSLAEILITVLVLAVFVAVGSFAFGMGLGARQVPGIVFGLFFAGFAMLMGVATGGPLALLLHVPVALLMAALGRQAAQQSNQGGRQFRRRSSGPVVWDWNGSSGYDGGWSNGGGGFSQGWGGFGGGSSGGGGASGSW